MSGIKETYNILVLGHGNFPSGITSAMELIMGKQSDYDYIDYDDSVDLNEFKQSINKSLKRFQFDRTLILCDLKNGTPFNIAMQLSIKEPKISVFYGLNLAMLISFVSHRLFSEDESLDIDEVIEESRNGIGILDLGKLDIENEDTEDDL